ncbi:MAG TPA: feruloyl-CoA synthase [Polyangiaceae bacterium]|nr:feruloyl-CoA synthase [Polyangiaceae bacterium]
MIHSEPTEGRPSFRKATFGAVDIEQLTLPDGSIVLRSRVPLSSYPRALTSRLVKWAEQCPDRPFLARRDGAGPFRVVTYGETLRRVERLGEWLLARGLSASRPIAVLAENGIEHALLGLAALHVGIPYSPISPAYALLSTDLGKLRHVMKVLSPGLVVVSEGAAFERAVRATVPDDADVVVIGRPFPGRKSVAFESIGDAPTAAVAAAHQGIAADHVAKVLFTSGSTGLPKGVINTHRMLTSNLRQIMQSFPCMEEEPLTLVDWLPWNHTFGGNHNFGLVLESGGTLYIDDGKPTPQGISTTVANLREISTSVYFNVPRGFVELLPYLESDAALRRTFFSRLKLLFYAGAGLAQPVWDGLQRLAVAETGSRIVMTSGLGCTESSPSALFAHWEDTWSGLLGVPVPGLELKLAKVGEKIEARYRGPNITPGYFKNPEATAAAFDEEGFYRTGDALKFVAPGDPNAGMRFDGRIAEDFKLSSGTWVNFGSLRAAVLDACAPLVADAVLTAPDRHYVGAILFPSLPACAAAAGLPDGARPEDVVAHPVVRQRVREGLAALAAKNRGGTTHVTRALLTAVPPSLDAHEITDKGSLNQRAVLDHRAATVESLYADPPARDVIVVDAES